MNPRCNKRIARDSDEGNGRAIDDGRADKVLKPIFQNLMVLLIHREIQALRASDDGTGRICEGRRGKRSVIEVLPHL